MAVVSVVAWCIWISVVACLLAVGFYLRLIDRGEVVGMADIAVVVIVVAGLALQAIRLRRARASYRLACYRDALGFLLDAQGKASGVHRALRAFCPRGTSIEMGALPMGVEGIWITLPWTCHMPFALGCDYFHREILRLLKDGSPGLPVGIGWLVFVSARWPWESR